MKNSIAALIALFLFSTALFAQDNINKFDDKGQRHGLWKGIHEESKRSRYEGTFNHGKETGVFKYFDDTKAGPVIATRDFTAKDGSCYTTIFDQKGNKVSEGREKNRVHEGEWKFYHQESPVVMTIEKYKNGKLEGVRKVFYKNKALNEETTYKNGIKDGPYRKLTEKGAVLEECVYKNGELHGPAVYRDIDGKVLSKGSFVNGKKMGIWQFFENGKMKEVNMSDPKNKQNKA
jgi:antitoxin component YwqK of YwqJK toxin-antitoxin module